MSNNPEELIRKLLAMAEGGTEHEAALAAQRANELALKYNIDLIALQSKNDDAMGQDMLDGRTQQWISNILHGVCLVNAVKFYHQTMLDGNERYKLYGKAHNVRLAKMIASYLVKEVKRLNTHHVKQHEHLDNPSERGAYRKAFRLAASQRLYARLREQYNELRTNDTTTLKVTGLRALVVANYFDSAISQAEEYLARTGTTLSKVKAPRSISIRSSEGWNDGVKAGNSISLAKQVSHDTVPGHLTRK